MAEKQKRRKTPRSRRMGTGESFLKTLVRAIGSRLGTILARLLRGLLGGGR